MNPQRQEMITHFELAISAMSVMRVTPSICMLLCSLAQAPNDFDDLAADSRRCIECQIKGPRDLYDNEIPPEELLQNEMIVDNVGWPRIEDFAINLLRQR